MSRTLHLAIRPNLTPDMGPDADCPFWDRDAWSAARMHIRMGHKAAALLPAGLTLYALDLSFGFDESGVYDDATTGVYVMHAIDTEWVKVGLTGNLKSRVATLQTGSPFTLDVYEFIAGPARLRPGLSALEDALHAAFTSFGVERRPGSEWFRMDPWLASEALRYSINTEGCV